MAHSDPDAGWRKFVLEGATAPATSLPVAPLTTGVEPSSFTLTPGPPSYDVIDLLPPHAQDLLRKLRLRATDAHAVCVSFEQIHEASMERINAETALTRLTAHPQNFGFNLKADDRRVIEAQKRLDKATADYKRLQELQATRTTQWQSASQATATCEVWLRDGKPHGTVLEAVEIEPPKPGKGENGLLDQIEGRRRRVRELKADLHRIASAPFPSSYAKQRARAAIEALAQRGQPDVSLLIEHDGDIVWPTIRARVEILNAQPGAIGFAEIPDMLAIDAWRNKDATLAKLDAEINTEADDGSALTHEERELRTAEVMADMLSAEFEEAALTWRAMDERLPCEFRADCSPLAILQLRLVTAAGTDPSPGSSWMHAFDLVMPGRR